MATLLQENIEHLLKEELVKYAGFFEGIFRTAPHVLTVDDFDEYFDTIRKLRSIDKRYGSVDGDVYEYYEQMQ